MYRIKEYNQYHEKKPDLRGISTCNVYESLFSSHNENVQGRQCIDCAGYNTMYQNNAFTKTILYPDLLGEQYRRKRFSFRENCILASQNFEDDLLLTADVHIDLAALDICEYYGFDPEVFKDEFKEHIVEFVCRYELMNRGAV